jgi:hypothetical protein
MKMTKNQKLTAPAQAPGREPAVQPSGEPQYERMVAAHLISAAPGRYLEDTMFKASMGRATYDLYERLAPRDAQDSILALLTVSVANASLDCLALAARVPPDYLDVRELNLRYGFKGAAVAAELIKAREDRHREKADKVTVGAVNVEAGGQAIVGNVKSARDSAPTKDSKE